MRTISKKTRGFILCEVVLFIAVSAILTPVIKQFV